MNLLFEPAVGSMNRLPFSYRFILLAAGLCLLAWLSPAAADDRVVALETRPGVRLSSYFMPREGARANLLLLTGGAGGIGLKDGVPTSENFLVRSRDRFAAAGFNVFIMGRPADRADLDAAFRTSAPHIEDLRQAVAFLRSENGLPVWLVGTSRGTISGTAGAIALGKDIAGLVLTSSVTDFSTPGAVPTQQLDAIRVPTLVVHHARDACRICQPLELPRIMDGLANAPVRKLLVFDGGGNARGNPCEPLHWHGFIGMEAEAVAAIAAWIADPQP